MTRGEPPPAGTGRLLATVSMGYGATFLGMAVVSPLLPAISASLALTPLAAGVALSLLWAVRAVVQYPSGRLADRVSRPTLLVAGLVAALAGVLLLAGAPTYAGFLAATVLLGLGNGLYPPAAIALVTDRFERAGQSLGVLIGTADLAGALAGLLAVAVAAAPTWRFGLLPVAAVLVVAVVLLDASRETPYERPRGLDLDVAATARRLFGDADRRTAVAGFALWMVAFQGAVSFLPTFLVVEKAVSLELAGGGFALLWGVGAAVKPGAGRLGDRYGHLPMATLTLGLSAAGLIGLVAVEGTVPLTVAVVAFAAGLLATTPMVWAHLAAAAPDASVGGDVGALRTTFEAVGSLGPLGVGAVAGVAGYGVGFAGLAACLVVAALLIGWLAVRSTAG